MEISKVEKFDDFQINQLKALVSKIGINNCISITQGSLEVKFDPIVCVKKMSLTLGIKTKEELIREINPWELQKEMIENMRIHNKKVEVDLVFVKVSELGIGEEKVSIKRIYGSALSRGLECCPPEVGPLLFLQKGSPRGHIFVGMKPMKVELEGMHIFRIHDIHKGALVVSNIRSDEMFTGDDVFVFVDPSDK